MNIPPQAQTEAPSLLSNCLKFIMLIIGLVLLIDGAILLMYKKIHLGTLLPLLIGLVFCAYSLYGVQIKHFLKGHPKLSKLWRLGWAGFWLWAVSLMLFFIYLSCNIDDELPTQKVDAVIVLGSGISQGQASPTLALRLDRAAEVAALHPKALIIVSGGLDYGETRTEAEVMSDYLQHKFQIDANRITTEDQSTSTALNLKNSQAILAAHQLSPASSIAVVTSDFHTLRAQAIAQKQGYTQVISVSAETPLTTRYNAWLREYFAYMSGWLLSEY